MRAMNEVLADPRERPWQRAIDEVPRRHGFEPLRVEGRLPEALRGTLYRNGPLVSSPDGVRYGHWYDGEAAITAVRLSGDRAEGAFAMIHGERAAPNPGLIRRLLGEVPNRASTSVWR